MAETAEARNLTTRQLEALRLDLEDRQTSLITELYGAVLQRSGVSTSGLDPKLLRTLCVENAQKIDSVSTGDPECAATAATAATERRSGGEVGLMMLGRLERLYAANRALARMDRSDFGRCARCGASIEFDVLAGDPVRLNCPACAD